MADDRRAFQTARSEKLFHVGGHQRIIHFRAVRRQAVVAMVHGEDVKLFREPLRDEMPVVRRTEQAVQQNNRPALPGFFEMKLHDQNDAGFVSVTRRTLNA